MTSGSRVLATRPMAPSPIFIRVPSESEPSLWLATISSSPAASSKMASSPPVTPRSDTARFSTASSTFDSSSSPDSADNVSSSAVCSSERRRASVKSRAFSIAMAACGANISRRRRSSGPNFRAGSECTLAMAPTSRFPMSSGATITACTTLCSYFPDFPTQD